MHPTKAYSLDGFHDKFFQNQWSIVGKSVSSMLLGHLNSGHDFHALNGTFITLIPKIKDPISMAYFRPISLCNVIYKLLSKVLVNRFKPILNRLIGETQSAFVSNRLIIDNILISKEAIHWHNSGKKTCDKTSYALKIDMSKAYDRLE